MCVCIGSLRNECINTEWSLDTRQESLFKPLLHFVIPDISDVNITMDKTAHVQEGTDIKLTCSVHSHPRVFFTWTRNGEKVDDYMLQITVRNGFYVGVLHRRKIKREMGGNYTCLAQSFHEGLSISASKLLHVRCKYQTLVSLAVMLTCSNVKEALIVNNLELLDF